MLVYQKVTPKKIEHGKTIYDYSLVFLDTFSKS